MENDKFAEGLRRMADWYEEHPNMEQPTSYNIDKGIFTVCAFNKEGVIKAKEEFGKGCALEVDSNYFNVFKSFGNMQLNAFASRGSVCKKKVVGTKKVMRTVATQWTEREEEEEIVEWECPPELLA